jgi:mono/diheme cytochrome c family protein
VFLMKRGAVLGGLLVLLFVVSAMVAGARAAGARPAILQGGGSDAGWTVPPTAAAEKNPLTVNDTVLAAGKKLFGDKCARCHGVRGKGDGPDGDESHQEDMDLTVASRAARNPDGVLFYKIWNGRLPSKMDPMSKELTRDQVWSLVAYVQTLRAKASDRP